MPYVFSLHPRQCELRDLAAGPARHILGYGGSRSGKTFAFCYFIAVRALSAPESRHLISRLHNVDVKQSVMMDTWPKMMRLAFPGVQTARNLTDQFVTLPNNSEVWFGGLDDADRVDKILGKEFATVYVNEASQVAFQSVVTLRSRLAQVATKTNGRPLALKAYYDLNPTGRGHWTYREFVEGKRPDNELPIEPGSRAYLVLNPTDNPALAAEYLKELDAMPERQRQRFFLGEYLSEVPGALWPLDRIEGCRVAEMPPLVRVVIGVDPSGSDGVGGDNQGIIVAGLGVDGRGYVLSDDSCRLSPDGWAKRVDAAYKRDFADLVVAEANYGGAMVESTLRTANPNIPVKLVHASRGKHVRAEPIAALYEQGKVSHLGVFPELEGQMGMMTTEGYQGGDSPGNLDALVWALTELMVEEPKHRFGFA